jgi:hypothetical protein
MDGGQGLEVLSFLLILMALIGVYYLSLVRHPYVMCSKCHGQPKLKGGLLRYAHHTCPVCKGSGQELRLGRKLFNMGEPPPP